MKSAMIFGVTGQDGSHLTDLLLDKGYEVIGIKRRSSTDTTSRLQHINSSKFKLIEGDITDPYSVSNVLKCNAHVDEVYNLAAQSNIGTSFKQPALTWDINGKGCINILQSIVDLNLQNIKFYQASSGEMFGNSYSIDRTGTKYQDENTKFCPESPYAIAKCAAHHAVGLFRKAYNLHANSGILFNHEGPRRGEGFVTRKITRWIVDFKLWLQENNLKLEDLKRYKDNNFIYGKSLRECFPKLKLGNINIYRDWGYAGDYVESMWLMLQQEIPDDYVICTGNTHSISDFLNIAFSYIGVNNWVDFILIDESLYRPTDTNFLCGNNTKAINKLQWKPKYNLNMLISLMIDCELNDKLSYYARHI